MPQNRPDLIKRFIGVASNIIAHKVLIKTEIDEDTREYYNKEVERDIDVALKYRAKINPIDRILPAEDARVIRKKILLRVNAELAKRKKIGYNADIFLADDVVDKFLRENKVA